MQALENIRNMCLKEHIATQKIYGLDSYGYEE